LPKRFDEYVLTDDAHEAGRGLTYFEKTPYSTPFQIGVAVEELGISGNTSFQFNWFSKFYKLF
jgi:hypothetical protein